MPAARPNLTPEPPPEPRPLTPSPLLRNGEGEPEGEFPAVASTFPLSILLDGEGDRPVLSGAEGG